MSDISFKVKAEALGKQLENISNLVEEEINEAVKNLAHAAYANITAKLQQMNVNSNNRKDYLKGLDFEDIGDDSYLITLDGDWANKLEKGFGAYSIRDVLLKSSKIVGVGKRSGEPWVRKAKDGHKYAAVPFEHKRSNPTGDLAKDIKNLMGTGISGAVQPISKIFKNPDDKPIHGKVATVKDAENPRLKGLVKYQYVHESGRVSSLYMTYRMVSENGKDWTHPGFHGYHLFKEAQDFVEKEMDNIIKTLLK